MDNLSFYVYSENIKLKLIHIIYIKEKDINLQDRMYIYSTFFTNNEVISSSVAFITYIKWNTYTRML